MGERRRAREENPFERVTSREEDVEKGAPAGVFGYAAGKSIIAKKLIKLFPEHHAYVEPFCGSAAMFFTKSATPIEALNDRDADVIGALKAIKSISKSELEQLRDKDWVAKASTFDRVKNSSPESKVDRLYKFLYVVRCSYAKNRKTFSPAEAGKDVGKRMVDRVVKGHERLAKAVITCGDYEKSMRDHDGKDAFHFLDPPYAGYNRGDGIGEKEFDEARFRKALEGLKGRFLVTYGTKGKLDTSGFEVKRMRQHRAAQFMHTNRTGQAGGDSTITHLLVSNFKVTKKSLGDGVELDDVMQIVDTEEGDRILMTGSRTSASVPEQIGGTIALRAALVGKRYELELALPGQVWTLDVQKELDDLRDIAKTDVAYAVGSLTIGVGATAIAKVTAPMSFELTDAAVELGLQTETSREFFLTKSETGLNGTLQLELPEDVPLGSKYPWLATLNDRWPSAYDFTVLKSGAPMPPEGTSALPSSIEKIVPEPMRFWAMKGGDAIAARAALVASRLLSGDRIAMVDGEFTRVVPALALPSEIPTYSVEAAKLGKAEWSTAYVNKLPDSAFLYIEAGGEKDEGGLTKPRSLRYFPVRDKDGNVDAAHAENAVGRIPQSDASGLDASKKSKLQDKARKLLASVQKVDLSSDMRRDAVQAAIQDGLGVARDSYPGCWIVDCYDDAAVYSYDGGLWRVGYTMDGASAKIVGTPERVVRTYEPVDKAVFEGQEPREKKPSKLREYTPSDDSPDLGKAAEFNNPDAGIGPGKVKPKERTEKALEVKLIKAEGDERIVYGIVLEPDVVDAQKDTYDAATVRTAAHDYMERFQNAGLMHKKEINDKAKVIESFIAPADLTINGQHVKKGAWVMAMRILDADLWKAAKRGELGGFSIGGSAKRFPEEPAKRAS